MHVDVELMDVDEIVDGTKGGKEAVPDDPSTASLKDAHPTENALTLCYFNSQSQSLGDRDRKTNGV